MFFKKKMFDPKVESEKISDLIKKRDKEGIMNFVVQFTNQQRLQIRNEYQITYFTELIEDINSAFNGHFKDSLKAMFLNPIEYDCFSLRDALKGIGTDEETLIEIIVTRPRYIIKRIIEIYPKKIEEGNLIEDIKSKTSGYFREVLLSLLNKERSENNNPNIESCERLAKALYEERDKKWDTDDSVFNTMITLQSPIEIAYISRAYHKLTGHTILQEMNSKFSGSNKKLLNAVVYALISPSEYFATRVNQAIKGLGTNDKLLIRIMVSRNEIDMPYIRQYYKQLFKKDMINEIKGDTSGYYEQLLVKLAQK